MRAGGDYCKRAVGRAYPETCATLQCEECARWEYVHNPEYVPSRQHESMDAMDLATMRADCANLWPALRSAERLFILLGKVRMTSHDFELLAQIGEELVRFQGFLEKCGRAH